MAGEKQAIPNSVVLALEEANGMGRIRQLNGRRVLSPKLKQQYHLPKFLPYLVMVLVLRILYHYKHFHPLLLL